jgi:hypothetical protein
LHAFKRLPQLNTMISILKKRQEGQIFTDTTTLSDLNAYYPRRGQIQLLTAFCPPAQQFAGRAKDLQHFWKRQYAL